MKGVMFAAVAAVSAVAPAGATVHNYKFDGHNINNPAATVAGYLGYDDAGEQVPLGAGYDPNHIAAYRALTYFSAAGSDFSLRGLGASPGGYDVLVGNDTINQEDAIRFDPGSYTAFSLPSGLTLASAALLFDDFTASSWTTAAVLPSDVGVPTLSLRRFFLNYTTTGADYTIDHFVSIADVPEPASWAMMIAGFGLAGAATRRVNNRAPSRRAQC
ncbi:PEPxxWA-CTERM sorting domain-containing protein [Sphingomonas tabacisoli]|uniref:PEPxxWA-CTERM sorting domain-containing protein n=1 Tax=Sphingomonas tabacisoli TaxID=2249466 RepID=A0ABW4I0C1_9SPHN